MYSSSTDTDYEEAVLSVLGELKLPIILDADIGHKPPQFTIINGSITNILSRGRKGIISFESR
jgi:muramoyltetrapeptide carboxypeptidase LdcA involved in peptidoglycan recycling